MFGVGKLEDFVVGSDCDRKRAYPVWSKMLQRCYDEKSRHKHIAYAECSVDDRFLSLGQFYNWCLDQKGFINKGWALDKDILVKGNKIYSPDTCCFVPQEVNNLFVKNKNIRGDNPIGVYKVKGESVYRAEVCKYGKGHSDLS